MAKGGGSQMAKEVAIATLIFFWLKKYILFKNK
jgi:hypothetical protein